MRRVLTALVVAMTLSSLACSRPAAPRGPATEPKAAPKVTIHYGPITWVMDSPSGQMSKARAQIEQTSFVASMTALGVTVEYVEAPELTDKAAIYDGITELGRADIREMGQDGNESDRLTALVKDHFKL
jgi:hypothetical protein